MTLTEQQKNDLKQLPDLINVQDGTLTEQQKNTLKQLPDDVCEFIFDEAVKKLASVTANTDGLDKKAYTILCALVFIIGLVSSFVIPSLLQVNTVFLIPFSVLIAGLLLSLRFLVRGVTTTDYYSNGFQPSEIVPPREEKYTLYYVKYPESITECSKEKILREFYLNFYNDAIEHNSKVNQVKGKEINKALNFFLGSLVLFVVCFIVLSFFTNL